MQGFQAVIDTGCSKFVTPDVRHFVPGTFAPSTSKTMMHGIAGGLSIEGSGTVAFKFLMIMVAYNISKVLVFSLKTFRLTLFLPKWLC